MKKILLTLILTLMSAGFSFTAMATEKPPNPTYVSPGKSIQNAIDAFNNAGESGTVILRKCNNIN
jgi:hypothetical protein